MLLPDGPARRRWIARLPCSGGNSLDCIGCIQHLAQGSERLWHLAWYSLASAGKGGSFLKGLLWRSNSESPIFWISPRNHPCRHCLRAIPPPPVRIRAGVNFNHPPFLSALATFPKRAPSESIGFYLLVYVGLSLPLPLPMSHEYA